MHNLNSGDRFPCTIKGTADTDFKETTNQQLLCIFEVGATANKALPMRVYVTNFTYV